MAIDGARLYEAVLFDLCLCRLSEAGRWVAAHLSTAGTEPCPAESHSCEAGARSNEYLALQARRRSMLDVEPGQHGMSIRCRKHGVSNVVRLTAVLMVARTCSRVRTHGRGRPWRCGVGSQAHRAPSAAP